jgi:hypothetical protein
MRSKLGGVVISIFLISVWLPCKAQYDEPDHDNEYVKIYEATRSSLLNDPFLQNGIYYSYPYYNAVGHPFLGDGEFESGNVIFRGRRFEGITINYDLFNQQIILSRKSDEILQMNLLANEFITEFTFKGKRFIKFSLQGEFSPFFQVVSETPKIACYYLWYKERRELLDAGNQRIYSFSEQKSKHYLILNGKPFRYKNNRTFVQLLPDPARGEIKDFMKENRIFVEEANDQLMQLLIEHCNNILEQQI